MMLTRCQALLIIHIEDKQAVISNETVQVMLEDIAKKLGADGCMVLRESGAELV